MKRAPSIELGLLLYAGYLAIFFTTWVVNGIDYVRIGANAETVRLWYALPTLFGCAFLVVAITVLGWWRLVLFDRSTAGPRWVWILPAAMAAVIVHNVVELPIDRLPPGLLLWALLGAVGVGFGEEMITRGSLVVGLRSRWSEGPVWLVSSLLFAALHAPNVFFGLPPEAMPAQLLLTFVMGGGFYVIRRVSGTLLLPMLLHGLWDSSLFLHVAAGQQPSPAQFLVYPVAIVCVIAMMPKQWNSRVQS